MTEQQITGEALFEDAARTWLDERALYLDPGTINCYGDYLKRLAGYFVGMPLQDIRNEHLRDYQRTRSQDYSACSVNHDLNTLSQILQRAQLWNALADGYTPLQLPKWTPPRVLKRTEEDSFFTFAASNPSWELAYLVATLTVNSSASGCELRGLRTKDVQLDAKPPLLFIPSDSVKNEYRARVIPLNERATMCMERILDRARALGSVKPHHYVFPFRIKRNCFDPTRPATESWIKTQWRELVDAAVEKGIISHRIRPHDMRHQAVTKLLEKGAPEETVRSIAGHVSVQMMRHYSHVRVESKLTALQTLDSRTETARPKQRLSPLPNSSGLSIAGLVGRLKKAGLTSDQVLEIISGEEIGGAA
ncbi:MAG TPA: site-specific integrase [Candidatus Angelobacter sp.]|nr:site-specific integrase [Candidatus Angelobacter sp.]